MSFEGKVDFLDRSNFIRDKTKLLITVFHLLRTCPTKIFVNAAATITLKPLQSLKFARNFKHFSIAIAAFALAKIKQSRIPGFPPALFLYLFRSVFQFLSNIFFLLYSPQPRHHRRRFYLALVPVFARARGRNFPRVKFYWREMRKFLR